MRIRKYLQTLNSDKLAWAFILCCFLAASVFVIQKGPFLGSDSYAYLKMNLIRPAGYPLFLFLLKIFGGYNLVATVVVQTVINAVVLIIFIRYLCKTFNVQAVWVLLLLPLILYYFIEVVEPEKILTESLAFPIFLLLSIFFIKGVLERNLRSLVIVLIINVFLVTVRGQFLFVLPLTALAGVYIIFRNNKYWRARYIGYFGAILVAALFSSSLINKTYHYIFNGKFIDVQMNLSFIRNAIYVADEEDSRLFEDEKIQKIYSEIYDSVYVSGINMDGFYDKVNPQIAPEERKRSDLIRHYHENLNEIAPLLRGDMVITPFNPAGETETIFVRDRVLKEIAFKLIKDNYPNYLYVNFSEIFLYAFSGSRIFLILFFTLFATSLFGLIGRNGFFEILFFFLIAHVGNLTLMALSDRVLERYMFYTEFIIVAILFLLLIKSIKAYGDYKNYPASQIKIFQ